MPIVSLLAERLSRIVAPAIAWSELGGSGTQRSSQISIPTTNGSRAGLALARCLEEQVNAERGVRETQVDLGGLSPSCRLKPTMLVEFLVSGKVLLGDDPADGPVADDDGAVEQTIADADRCTHNDELRPAGRGAGDFLDRPDAGLQQHRLRKEVGARVAVTQSSGKTTTSLSDVKLKSRLISAALAAGSATIVRGEAQVMRTKPYRFIGGQLGLSSAGIDRAHRDGVGHGIVHPESDSLGRLPRPLARAD